MFDIKWDESRIELVRKHLNDIVAAITDVSSVRDSVGICTNSHEIEYFYELDTKETQIKPQAIKKKRLRGN